MVIFFMRNDLSIRLLLFSLLLFFSLIRYLTRRQKSIETAYHGIITTLNEVLPSELDPVIYADLKKDVLYPNERLYKKIQENNNKGGMMVGVYKSFYSVVCFFYVIGLCLIPGFSYLTRSSEKRKVVSLQEAAAKQQQRMRRINEKRNKMLQPQRKSN